MACIIWLWIVAVTLEAGRAEVVVEANNDTVSSGEAVETQQATCRIVTEELAATASATVSHALKGVCATSKNFIAIALCVKNQ